MTSPNTSRVQSGHLPGHTRQLDSITTIFITHDAATHLRLYETIVIPKLLYGSPVVRYSRQAKLMDLMESLQHRRGRRFLKRLSRRCNLGDEPLALPSIRTRLFITSLDVSALASLRRVGIARDIFVIRENNPRCKGVDNRSRSHAPNLCKKINLYAWRVRERVHTGDIPPSSAHAGHPPFIHESISLLNYKGRMFRTPFLQRGSTHLIIIEKRDGLIVFCE